MSFLSKEDENIPLGELLKKYQNEIVEQSAAPKRKRSAATASTEEKYDDDDHSNNERKFAFCTSTMDNMFCLTSSSVSRSLSWKFE